MLPLEPRRAPWVHAPRRRPSSLCARRVAVARALPANTMLLVHTWHMTQHEMANLAHHLLWIPCHVAGTTAMRLFFTNGQRPPPRRPQRATFSGAWRCSYCSAPLWSCAMVFDGQVADHDPEGRWSCSGLHTWAERFASVSSAFFDRKTSSARTLVLGTGAPCCLDAISGVKVDQLVTGSRRVVDA